MTDLSARLRDVLSDEQLNSWRIRATAHAENAYERDFDRDERDLEELRSWRDSIISAVEPLLSSLLEEREREIREAVNRLVKKATEPVTFMDAYRCSVCGASFHPPQVHTAHPWCPVYNLQEIVLSRLGSSSSPAAPQEQK